MKKYYRDSNKYVILDHNTGSRIELERAEAKALARFLLVEFNIVSATLNDGRKIEEIDQEFIKLLKGRIINNGETY